MANQIQISETINKLKFKRKSFIGPIRIDVNLSGISGWARGVANFIQDKDGAITQALNDTLSTMQKLMLNQFNRTRGRSRWVEPSSGRTKRSIMSGSVFGPEIMGDGKWFLKSYEISTTDDHKYILMQEHGWKAFRDKQPFLRVLDPITGKSSLRSVKKSAVRLGDDNVVVIDVRHPKQPSREFFLAGVTYWETSGKKDFEKRRLSILRNFIAQGGK